MKVSRSILIKILKQEFESMGYTYFKDSISAAKGFFAKKLDNGFFVSIAIEMSTLYENSFTCDMYLAKSLDIYYLYKDCMDMCQRPGFLLDSEEILLFQNSDTFEYDIWWHSDNADSIADFMKVLHLAEPRFINNDDLKNRICSSIQSIEICDRVKRVRQMVCQNQQFPELKFTPKKEIDGIPLNWFRCSEFTLMSEKVKLNKNLVWGLAADAYRQNILCNIYEQI